MLLRRLFVPVIVFVSAIALATSWNLFVEAWGGSEDASVVKYGRMALEIVAWFSAAFFLVRFFDGAIWRGIVQRRSGAAPPRLLIDLIAGIIWVATVVLVLVQVFDLPMAGFVTTSSVAIAIVGFAARDMIASLFSGIAINVEHPYRTGDWIEVEPNVVGKVLEISWLTTRTVTRDGIGIIVPNARLATAPFRNYNHPHAYWRDSVAIALDPMLPAERVERVLLAAMNAIPEVAALPNKPDVKIKSIDDRGVSWQARFWVSDYGAMPETRYVVQKSILKHLHHAGIAIAYPKRDLALTKMPPRFLGQHDQLKLILERNELFADLTESELHQLAQGAEVVICQSGSAIIREGDAGASLFVLVEGLLHVFRTTNGQQRRIDELSPGTVFGEFSLLTGEPRSSTIIPYGDALVFEIGKGAIAPILNERMEIAQRLSCILADRQAHNASLERDFQQDTTRRARPVDSKEWYERLQSFLGLGST